MAPKPSPNVLEPIAPLVATRTNAARPAIGGSIDAARAFYLPGDALDPTQGLSAQNCLAQAVYYEAAGQPLVGQRAVAQVVINRMRHPAYPKSICGVVYQGVERGTGCQFTFVCDGSLARKRSAGGWIVAEQIARRALAGAVEPAVGTATHYHADYVVPYWSPTLLKLVTIGNHIFYRYPGFWGSRAALTGTYAGEPANLVQRSLPGVGAIARVANLVYLPLPDKPGRYFGSMAVSEPGAGNLAVPKRNPALRADDSAGHLVVADVHPLGLIGAGK